MAVCRLFGWPLGCLLLLGCRSFAMPSSDVMQPMTIDWPVWESFTASDPRTQLLALTGPDLHWDAPVGQGKTRLFLCNHPEAILDDTPEGKLWCEEVSVGADAVSYRLFFQHYNFRATPIYYARCWKTSLPRATSPSPVKRPSAAG